MQNQYKDQNLILNQLSLLICLDLRSGLKVINNFNLYSII
jgi:hypothetical protein